jgi:siroheme synthase-like protein
MLRDTQGSGSMKLNTRNKKNPLAKANRLFPVFVKLERLRVIVVGGGKVAEEKLNAILANAPTTAIRVVSKTVTPAIRKLAKGHPVQLHTKSFEPSDLLWGDIVFSAVNDVRLSRRIHTAARKIKILHNAADKPELCDFYLGSIVQKGNLKIGISTNGKSPTVAKRLKEILENTLPDEIDEVLDRLSSIRDSLRGDMKEKILRLNAITSILVPGAKAKKLRSKVNKE